MTSFMRAVPICFTLIGMVYPLGMREFPLAPHKGILDRPILSTQELQCDEF